MIVRHSILVQCTPVQTVYADTKLSRTLEELRDTKTRMQQLMDEREAELKEAGKEEEKFAAMSKAMDERAQLLKKEISSR